VSGIASALVGQPGTPVLIYLLLAGAEARTVAVDHAPLVIAPKPVVDVILEAVAASTA
jgi:hypothetical protein